MCAKPSFETFGPGRHLIPVIYAPGEHLVLVSVYHGIHIETDRGQNTIDYHIALIHAGSHNGTLRK
jgi:hypothetical protein